jgi:hypothetical protein
MANFDADAFSGSAGTDLTAGSPATGGPWSVLTGSAGTMAQDGSGRCYTTGGGLYAMAGAVPGGTPTSVRANLYVATEVLNYGHFLALVDGSGNGYHAGYYNSAIYIQTRTGTTIASASTPGPATLGSTYAQSFDYDPSTHSYSFTFNGQTIGPVVDATWTPTRAGLVAISTGAGPTTGAHVGPFSAGDPGGSPGPRRGAGRAARTNILIGGL